MTSSTPLNITVITVSDTRTEETDKSGDLLVQRAKAAGHNLLGKIIVKDDVYQLRSVVSQQIADPQVNAILMTGGTGFTARDNTPKAISPLFDVDIVGFGELFRQLSFEEIQSSTIQSRAFAGLANGTIVFCVPGSPGACETAWDRIIAEQLSSEHKPCNFVDKLLVDKNS
ncbi:MAG: molybdenum cofactor biosynthesis protein B [Gammaproteobacteria bacterium]|jgi:molybdenum cofactor biosynthesis protein B|nr:molybdenum cofactor biosynthesis protein B [Gammaproteobacteria bacterium]MBT3859540.1 molybdenum cofactor biosynthesis protein B [Gammaproteobacteria bacterium]MBT3986566.1 molybdenum cofactor biosynthesis protein B [Gammaproteobacteria bacterium]MBT4256651.1 molybdenum cofactor biosynthesis protein B [Gammaproteobacteria bacterium]MBT4581090.1 molybdenum cofactor biosynthesis protein B [Gammaproteobacteria bacterium]